MERRRRQVKAKSDMGYVESLFIYLRLLEAGTVGEQNVTVYTNTYTYIYRFIKLYIHMYPYKYEQFGPTY